MTPNALYARYVEERRGLSSIWKPYGFLTYKVAGNECFIVDMFIEKSERKSGKGRELISELSAIARVNGCEVITANIHLADPNANKTLAASLATGFVVSAADADVLLISKKVKGE